MVVPKTLPPMPSLAPPNPPARQLPHVVPISCPPSLLTPFLLCLSPPPAGALAGLSLLEAAVGSDDEDHIHRLGRATCALLSAVGSVGKVEKP
jgi:hypothetical protein